MTFTQYKFPDGHQVPAFIDRPAEIEDKARNLVSHGWRFEIEIHPDTQLVHMDCCNAERALATCVVRNGPDVPAKVDELVNEAHEVFKAERNL